jgi:hypothetical protein
MNFNEILLQSRQESRQAELRKSGFKAFLGSRLASE